MYKQQWLTRQNKNKKYKFGHIQGDVEKDEANMMPISNTFEALTEKQANVENNKSEQGDKVENQHITKESIKDWVTNTFAKPNKDKKKVISVDKASKQTQDDEKELDAVLQQLVNKSQKVRINKIYNQL